MLYFFDTRNQTFLLFFLLSLLWKQQLSFKCYYGHTIESGRQCAACCCNHIPHELKFQSSWNTNVIIVGHGILFKCSIVTGTVPLRENVGDEAPPCSKILIKLFTEILWWRKRAFNQRGWFFFDIKHDLDLKNSGHQAINDNKANEKWSLWLRNQWINESVTLPWNRWIKQLSTLP